MTKEFNDHEFRLYGNVQSFFYRCWSMWGSHPEANTTTAMDRKLEMMRVWCGKLFPEDQTSYWDVLFLDEEHNRIQLIVQYSRVFDYKIFIVDLRHNLEDYDFYKIKWVHRGDSVKKYTKTTYREVPKVF